MDDMYEVADAKERIIADLESSHYRIEDNEGTIYLYVSSFDSIGNEIVTYTADPDLDVCDRFECLVTFDDDAIMEAIIENGILDEMLELGEEYL